jgi:hypothetical protein
MNAQILSVSRETRPARSSLKYFWLVLFLLFTTAFAQLRQTQFSDGTGSIGLAPGFQITENYKGSVSCVHSNGASIALGIAFVLIRPDSSVLSLPGARQHPIARAGDVGTALREILGKTYKAKLVRLRARSAPQAIARVPAYYVMYEFVQSSRSFTAIAYITSFDYGADNPWQLYVSAIVATTKNFVKMYPTMMSMWRSWKPNGQQPVAGSQSKIIDDILKDRRERMDTMQAAFRESL